MNTAEDDEPEGRRSASDAGCARIVDVAHQRAHHQPARRTGRRRRSSGCSAKGGRQRRLRPMQTDRGDAARRRLGPGRAGPSPAPSRRTSALSLPAAELDAEPLAEQGEREQQRRQAAADCHSCGLRDHGSCRQRAPTSSRTLGDPEEASGELGREHSSALSYLTADRRVGLKGVCRMRTSDAPRSGLHDARPARERGSQAADGLASSSSARGATPVRRGRSPSASSSPARALERHPARAAGTRTSIATAPSPTTRNAIRGELSATSAPPSGRPSARTGAQAIRRRPSAGRAVPAVSAAGRC